MMTGKIWAIARLISRPPAALAGLKWMVDHEPSNHLNC
jgi:hypothetical protein